MDNMPKDLGAFLYQNKDKGQACLWLIPMIFNNFTIFEQKHSSLSAIPLLRRSRRIRKNLVYSFIYQYQAKQLIAKEQMPIRIHYITLALLFLFFMPAYSQNKPQTPVPSRLIEELLFLEMHKYHWVLSDYKKYNVQIIYTQIFRDSLQPVPRLEHHSFNLPEDAYIYPASTVKLPVIAQSFEKVNTINLSGLSKYSRMGTIAGKYCYEAVAGNIPSDKNPPSIAKYAEQMLLVSDNQAYNRLYEFLGQAYLHQKLAQKGYEKIRIIKRFFSSCASDLQNRFTNAVAFYDEQCRQIYYQPEAYQEKFLPPPVSSIKLGKYHLDDAKRFYNAPMEMSQGNYLSLRDLHQILISLVLPEAVPEEKRFQLSEDDLRFLRRAMGAYPREGIYSKYLPQAGYFDAYKKYLFYGREPQATILPHLRIFNIVGLAYGFTTDAAYIVDFENNVEFLLSVSIYTNANETLNDNVYEYPFAFQFMKNIGRSIYHYERSLLKKYKKNLRDLDFYSPKN